MSLALELFGSFVCGMVWLLVVLARYGQRIVMWALRRQMTKVASVKPVKRPDVPAVLDEYVNPKP